MSKRNQPYTGTITNIKSEPPKPEEIGLPPLEGIKPPTPNEWTVMVYLAGDNNLAEEMVYALTSMQSVGSDPPNYEVFAMYDAGVGPTKLKIRDRHTAARGLLEDAEESLDIQSNKNVEVTQKLLKDAMAEQSQVEQLKNALNNQTKKLAGSAGAELELEDSKKGSLGKGSHFERAAKILEQVTGKIQTILKDAILKDQETKEAKEEVDLRLEDHRIVQRNRDAMADFRKARTSTDAMDAIDRLEPELGDSVEITLLDFIIDTVTKHPAKRYMLVLSGHGSGTVGDFLSVNRQSTGLSIPELRDTLQAVKVWFSSDENKSFRGADASRPPYSAGGKLDILGLDSCLMGMAEVAYEIRNHVEYLIGSEGFGPNTGWPYDHVLNLLQLNPTIEPEDFAKGIVSEYISFYSSDYTLAQVSTHLTALHLGNHGENIVRFAEALGGTKKPDKPGLSNLLKTALEDSATESQTKDKLVLAHWEAQGFKNENHVDIEDFCELLQKRYANDDPIWKACKDVTDAVAGLRRASSYCGPAFQHARGLSIFFPWANIADAAGIREVDHYGELEFAKNTSWDEFLKSYHRHTQREAREGTGAPHLSTLNRREGLFTGKPGKFGIPGSAKFGIPGSAKSGISGSAKFGIPGSAKFGIPGSAKFGIPGSAKFGIPGSAKFGIPGSAKFGIPGSAKFASGAASFEVFKIASMKNPPIIWFDQERKEE